jgi:hypothetical protein
MTVKLGLQFGLADWSPSVRSREIVMVEKRELYGKVRVVPGVRQWEFAQAATRWRLLRDGLAACIETLPVAEKLRREILIDVWAYAASQMEGALESRGEWQQQF